MSSTRRPWRFAAVVILVIAALSTPACQSEQSVWEEVQAQDSVPAYEEFLQQYPDGEFADSARQRIHALTHGAITGQMSGYDTGRHLEGAQILLCRLPEGEAEGVLCTLQAAPTTVAGDEGLFTLPDVPAGSYALMYAIPDELLLPLEECDGVQVMKASPCMENMTNSVCADENLPETLFWEDGGTLLGEIITQITRDDEDLIDAAIRSYFTGDNPGGLVEVQGGFRSDRTGISFMLEEAKLAPVISVAAEQTAEILWEVRGR